VGGEDHTARAADQTGTEQRRVTVAEAAEYLGITAEAVRTRIKRGKLVSVKEPPDRTGTVYVLLRADQTRPNVDPTSQGQDQTSDQTATGGGDRYTRSLENQVEYLRRQLDEEREARRRADTILAQLSQANAEQARTIRAIEAPSQEPPTESPGAPRPPDQQTPSEAPESPQMHTVGEGGATAPSEGETPTEPRSREPWWVRWFGG
jgi:hypothetical protein